MYKVSVWRNSILEYHATPKADMSINRADDSSLSNDQQRVILTFPESEDCAMTITEQDMEGLQPTKFLSNNKLSTSTSSE